MSSSNKIPQIGLTKESGFPILEGVDVDERLRFKKRDLEICLERLVVPEKPSPRLEQYPISTRVAAEMVWIAFCKNDIVGRKVVELGCGTGKLSIACALLNASHVTGIDIDPAIIITARTNSEQLGLQNRVSWVCGDIKAIRASNPLFDVIVMNPPFGVRGAPGTDIQFLSHAMRLGSVIYSLHLGRIKNRAYISEVVAKKGFMVDFISRMSMDIPYLFSYHRKRRHKITVDLYRIIKAKNRNVAP